MMSPLATSRHFVVDLNSAPLLSRAVAHLVAAVLRASANVLGHAEGLTPRLFGCLPALCPESCVSFL